MIRTWFMGLNPEMILGLAAIGIVLAVLIIVVKGMALWYAARRSEMVWFVALLILNTVGILELIYLFFVVKIGNDKHFEEVSKS